MSKVFQDEFDEIRVCLTREEAKGMLNMIKSVCLPERRMFNHLKEQLERIV